MQYIGKRWLESPISLQEVVEKMKLKDVKIFPTTEDAVGIYTFKERDVVVFLHISWGDMNFVKKFRMYIHSVDERFEDLLFRELINNLSGKVDTGLKGGQYYIPDKDNKGGVASNPEEVIVKALLES